MNNETKKIIERVEHETNYKVSIESGSDFLRIALSFKSGTAFTRGSTSPIWLWYLP